MEINSQTTQVRVKSEDEIRQDERIDKEMAELAEVRKHNTAKFLYDITNAAAGFRNAITDGMAICWSSGELLVHFLGQHGLKIERIENDDPVI